ncbi:MAG: tRNA lysidine(34) synthetase TilS [Bacteroidota bacterium]
MLRKFKTYMDEIIKLHDQQVILLAVSGGVDSIVLAHLLFECEFPFAIAHCNFQLRGETSNADATFVNQLAERYGVPFHEKCFDTQNIVKANKKSIQETARELRYEWFNELLTNLEYHYLATAHHLNDAIETMLYNLTKGTGIKGLHGILPRKGNLIRPLMFASRHEIEAFALQNNLDFREDVSNLDTKYSRNKIRHEVIPSLKTINPSLEKTFEENIGRFQEIEAIYEWAIKQLKGDAQKQVGKDLEIDLRSINASPAPKSLLFEILKDKGFSADHVTNILEEQSTSSGRTFFSPTHRLVTDRGKLLVSEVNADHKIKEVLVKENQTSIQLASDKFSFSKIDKSEVNFSEGKNVAFLDLDKISFPLTIRRWQQGDTFQPLGLRGQSQKVSDFFVNNKLSILEKEKVWLLETNRHICWIAGYRLDERFKISDLTRRILKVKLA